MKGDTFKTPMGMGGRKGVPVSYVSKFPNSTFKGCRGRIYKFNPRFGYSVTWIKGKPGCGIDLPCVAGFFSEEELNLIEESTLAKGKKK